MDCRTHERGVGMLNTPYVKKDTIKNFFPVPNAVFDLGLHHMEINIYAYLLRIEDAGRIGLVVSHNSVNDGDHLPAGVAHGRHIGFPFIPFFLKIKLQRRIVEHRR